MTPHTVALQRCSELVVVNECYNRKHHRIKLRNQNGETIRTITEILCFVLPFELCPDKHLYLLQI